MYKCDECDLEVELRDDEPLMHKLKGHNLTPNYEVDEDDTDEDIDDEDSDEDEDSDKKLVFNYDKILQMLLKRIKSVHNDYDDDSAEALAAISQAILALQSIGGTDT